MDGKSFRLCFPFAPPSLGTNYVKYLPCVRLAMAYKRSFIINFHFLFLAFNGLMFCGGFLSPAKFWGQSERIGRKCVDRMRGWRIIFSLGFAGLAIYENPELCFSFVCSPMLVMFIDEQGIEGYVG